MEQIRYQEIADRFAELVREHAGDLDQKGLAEVLETSQSSVSKIKKGTLLPSEDVVRRMAELWGEDISEEVGNAREYGRRAILKKTVSVEGKENGVPYYNVDFAEGFDLMQNDQTVNPSYIIDVKPYNKATCWCNITGHSMEPEINHGDMIALRKLTDNTLLIFGEIYAIVTKNELRTVKRIGPGPNEKTYTLIPSNKSPEYAPQVIKRADILHVFEVLGCIKKF